MSNVTFVVPGNAVPKQSFRYKSGRGRRGQVLSYQTPQVKSWEEAVGLTATEAMRGREPFTRPLRVVIGFYLSHRRICDLVNLEKGTIDACHGIVFKNDAQIVDEHLTKHQERGGISETRILIEEIVA